MKHFLSILIAALLSTSCTMDSVKKPPAPAPDLAAPAKALLQEGKSLQAAEYYQQLAEQSTQQPDNYRLLAAQIYLQSGNSLEAQQQVEQVNPAAISAQQRNQLYLLKAQIHLSLGEAEQALAVLGLISLKQLNVTEKKSYHQSRAFAYSLANQLIKSAQERVALSRYLDNPERVYDNNVAIYETLDLLSAPSLQAQQNPPPDILAGWMAITSLLKTKNSHPEDFQLELIRWQHLYPDHPADNAFLSRYWAQNKHQFKVPQVIAVLLPESGPYAKAAKAIRSGFDAAYRVDPQALKPQVRFYDSESADPASLYRQAITAGAELIIGPLHKKRINQLVESSDLSMPVLALNHIPGLKKKNLYQFGLSPIDEAEQITVQADSLNATRALILVPETELGKRLNEYYTQSWQDKEGTVLETQFYPAKNNDFSKSIKSLMNIDESVTRYERLRRLIPGVKFSPRTRSDADALFLSGPAKTLRLLNPQLHFYRARKIPAYATAQAYQNRPNPKQDVDLNGVTFCTIPWILDNDYLDQLSINSLRENGLKFTPAYLSLVALGMDAYNLVFHLNNMDTQSYTGATGQLLLTSDYRIKRQLPCAKFVAGLAQPLVGTIPEPIADELINPDRSKDNPFHVQ